MKKKLASLVTLMFLLLGMVALVSGLTVQYSDACNTGCCGGEASVTIPDCDEEAGEECKCTCTCNGAGCACLGGEEEQSD